MWFFIDLVHVVEGASELVVVHAVKIRPVFKVIGPCLFAGGFDAQRSFLLRLVPLQLRTQPQFIRVASSVLIYFFALNPTIVSVHFFLLVLFDRLVVPLLQTFHCLRFIPIHFCKETNYQQKHRNNYNRIILYKKHITILLS